MKYLIFTFLGTVLPFVLFAQPGFNKSHTIGDSGGSFYNGTVYNDTLYLTASIVTQGQPQTVALVRCDTNGTIISEHRYYHPGNKQVLFGRNYSIKVLSDQSVAFVASLNDSILLLRYNTQGALLNAMTVPDRGDSGSEVEPDFEEYLSGFIFGGSMVDTSNRGNAYLTRTDAVGNVLWTHKYGALPLDVLSDCMRVIDNNTIVIGAVLAGNIFTPQEFGQSWIVAVDSLGHVKWEWRGEIGSQRILDIVKMDNGDWMFTQANFYFESPNPIFPSDSVRGYTSLVRVDSNFNERWRTVFTPTLWNYGRSFDLIPTPDGNWMVSTYTGYGPYLGFIPSSDGGCLTKMTSEGEILWQSCDSIQWSLPACYSCDDIPSGHVVLPSGSSILVGRLVRYSPQPGRSFGWLYKVDANGCAMEPCSVSTAEPESERVVRIYPNPANTTIQVVVKHPDQTGNIQVFDSFGRLLGKYAVPVGTPIYTLDSSNWPSGMYVIQYEHRSMPQFTERVFVQH